MDNKNPPTRGPVTWIAWIGRSVVLALVSTALIGPIAAQTQTQAQTQAQAQNPAAAQGNDYMVGPQDVLTITMYDQADLSGRYSVDADGSFTFPLVGRVKASGMTLRQVESQLIAKLKDGGFFPNPQLSVTIEQYKSQKVFIVGEVRSPGMYPLSGGMSLVEVLARAGSTLPSASGEAVIVHDATPGPNGTTAPQEDPVRVDLHELQKGVYSLNVALRDGDTIFVPQAESVYVFGQVKNPGAYPLQKSNTTVLQALALAGGITERGSTSRIRIVRVVKGEKKEIKVKLTDLVLAGDSIVVHERIF
jgi:polysaccharide export outer membrane protein